ncbi:glycoside hydrolase family 5 protein [Leptospira sp. GIMC2001]|uniref:glycoside hydrolase family 5 protein n=1 Tax=Leptospira sp. GIMC2001 TaxID=1513297 RepID=UPI00234B9774|nr:cellulase family glycosylhydrolase [Leptospira sp. GIMC2001]WCL50574.1 cellulase family glycosylhydrolase [Leptospira sp. GIMC2001]
MGQGLKKLSTDKQWFIESETKRKVLLKGINLGGDTKVPFPNGGTQYPTDFLDHREVSFVGRPFPLEDAHDHFNRLKNWGFNCLRLLTTWEAVEHKGPGIYDEEYLDYFQKICEIAHDYGFYLFIDFHQDVWSRMTGGDGAPGWTLEKVGMDISKIASSDSSIVMQNSYDYSRPGIRQEENYPTMCWSQNYRYPANAIMWTLFFGGRDFAKSFMIDGQNVQDYLQNHYLGSMLQIANRVKDMDWVLGFDSLNEPSRGWIGHKMNDRGLDPNRDKTKEPSKPGLAWSPIDGLFSSFGYSIELPYLELSLIRAGFHPKKNVVVNPNRNTLWSEDSLGDPFRLEGAWELKDDMPFVLNNDFFCKVGERVVDFDRDYMIPFIHRVAESIRSVRNDWIVFAEREALESAISPDYVIDLPKNSVNANHWYDLPTLIFKKFNYPITIDTNKMGLAFGRNGIQEMYRNQLARIKQASDKQNVPTLLGEFGIPFDLESGAAYKKWKKGNRSSEIWKMHILALDLMYNAIDSLGIHSCLWNYTATNRNDLMIGDQWNQEDLSIYSIDQIDESFLSSVTNGQGYGSGGRAIEGFSRPYPKFISGNEISFRFDRRKNSFDIQYTVEEWNLPYPTEIFIPEVHFPQGFVVLSKSGDIEWSYDNQLLTVDSKTTGIISYQVSN